MAAPTFIQEAETSTWETNADPKTTASFNVLAGDQIVSIVVPSHSDAVNNYTSAGGSLTYTLRQQVNVSQYADIMAWTAPVDSDKAMTVTWDKTGGTASITFGGNALTFRGSDGIGASSKTNVSSGAPTLNITTTQANSAIVVIVADWNAVDGASRTWRTNAGALTELTYNRNAAQASIYIGYHADAGAIGTYAVGLSAPSGQKYAIVAVEVKGSAGAATTMFPPFRYRIQHL